MDPYETMNPYAQSSGFVNLLQSQQETHVLGHNPFESQCSDAPLEGESTVENRRSRHTWSPTDDVVLNSAWLNTSKVPRTSNQQKGGNFWQRIADYFGASPNVADRPKREAIHCKNRWRKIHDIVCKFVGCYDAATRAKSTGQNEDDVMKLANQIFFSDQKCKFTLEHAWRELRYDQKWASCASTKESRQKKRRMCVDGSLQSSSREEDDTATRPPGIKAAKAKRGLTNKAAVEGAAKPMLELQMKSVEKMYEFKEKNFALKEKDYALKEKEYERKEKHSKHMMLKNLIAKADQLTEAERALKDKLIHDMLS